MAMVLLWKPMGNALVGAALDSPALIASSVLPHTKAIRHAERAALELPTAIIAGLPVA
jgi:hypothetical protein